MTSNVVEFMKRWIIEERKFSIFDFLHSLWCKSMVLCFIFGRLIRLELWFSLNMQSSCSKR